MKAQWKRLVALGLLLCMTGPFFAGASAEGIPAAPQAGDLLEAIHIEPVDATSVEVSWTGGPETVTVGYFVKGQTRPTYSKFSQMPVLIGDLAPKTGYDIFVLGETQENVVMVEWDMPDPGPYREHGYRWNLCNPFFVVNGKGGFFERTRTRANEVSLDVFGETLLEGIYAVILEGTWNPTEAEKQWKELWVLRTPGGDVFTISDTNRCDPTWKSFYFSYPLAPLLNAYYASTQRWEAGTYDIEIYFDGAFAGRTKMVLKP